MWQIVLRPKMHSHFIDRDKFVTPLVAILYTPPDEKITIFCKHRISSPRTETDYSHSLYFRMIYLLSYRLARYFVSITQVSLYLVVVMGFRYIRDLNFPH